MTVLLSVLFCAQMLVTTSLAKEPKLSQQPKAAQHDLPYARPECPAQSTIEGLVSDGKGGEPLI